MANEAEIINNPDSTPGAVSTGYQLQNTNLVSQRTGIDKTYVSGGAGTITVEISGPVDVNGVLYDIKSQTILTPPSAGRYYITLQGAGPQYLTPTLSSVTAGYIYWSALKNAYYTVGDEYRVLDWLVDFDGTDCRVYRRGECYLEDWITSNTSIILPWSQVYKFDLGGKGGDGGAGFPERGGGGGGGAGAWGFTNKFLDAGTELTIVFSSSSGGNTTISEGASLYFAIQNGYDGSAGGYSTGGAGGAPGATSTGLIFTHSGYRVGTAGTSGTPGIGGFGGNSFCVLKEINGESSHGRPSASGYGAGGDGGSGVVGTTAGSTGSGGFVKITYI